MKIEGSHAIDKDEILPHLALERVRKGGRAVDPYQLQLDTERVRQAYIRKGFFGVKVESHVSGETGPQTVTFSVIEGPRAKTKVTFENRPDEVSESELRSLVPIKDGDYFDYEIYDLAKEDVLKAVQSVGYAYAEIEDSSVSFEDGIAHVVYRFNISTRCRFGQIQIMGVDGKLRSAVMNRLEFKAGETFSQKALDDTQHNLYDMGRFSTVHIEPDLEGGRSSVPIRMVLTPGGRGELRLGGGGGYDSIAPEVRGRFGLSYIPRPLPLWTLGVDGRIALAFRSLPDSVENPTGGIDYEWRVRTLATAQRIDLFYPRVTGVVGVGIDYLTFEAYTMKGPLAKTDVTFPLFARWLSFRLGWQIQYESFTNISDVLDDAARMQYGLAEDARVAAYSQSIIAEGRDDPQNTRKGVFFCSSHQSSDCFTRSVRSSSHSAVGRVRSGATCRRPNAILQVERRANAAFRFTSSRRACRAMSMATAISNPC